MVGLDRIKFFRSRYFGFLLLIFMIVTVWDLNFSHAVSLVEFDKAGQLKISEYSRELPLGVRTFKAASERGAVFWTSMGEHFFGMGDQGQKSLMEEVKTSHLPSAKQKFIIQLLYDSPEVILVLGRNWALNRALDHLAPPASSEAFNEGRLELFESIFHDMKAHMSDSHIDFIIDRIVNHFDKFTKLTEYLLFQDIERQFHFSRRSKSGWKPPRIVDYFIDPKSTAYWYANSLKLEKAKRLVAHGDSSTYRVLLAAGEQVVDGITTSAEFSELLEITAHTKGIGLRELRRDLLSEIHSLKSHLPRGAQSSDLEARLKDVISAGYFEFPRFTESTLDSDSRVLERKRKFPRFSPEPGYSPEIDTLDLDPSLQIRALSKLEIRRMVGCRTSLLPRMDSNPEDLW